MMNRLFWKIFLSFWVSLILFAGAGLLAASLFLEYTRAQNEIESPRDRHLNYVGEARMVAKHEGLQGLRLWLQKLDRSEAIPFLLIDQTGKDLLDRPVSSHLTKHLERWNKPRRSMGDPPAPKRRELIQVPGKGEYLLVPDFQAVTLNRVLSRPRVIALPVVVAAIISGLVCFLLAGYLTRPIRRLSSATQQFAAGNLSLRVASTMGKRRDEVADLAHDFDHMAERLQALIGSQKQLLSDVSHELRSPLARLQVALGLARQREQHQSNAELDRIEREAERLNELIGQLLSLTRLESGKQLTHSEPVDIATLLEEVAENADFEAHAANRQVRIIDSASATIEANEALLRSALENVVRNAVRYTNENTSVDITLQHDPEQAGWLVIHVRDHGSGVPDDMLTRLFEPFVRVGDARDRESGGYGLGLAIAERAIHLHGGVISASNEPSSGLNVHIHLPLKQAR